jgi:lipoprotein-anchoring transpeptidase ErfK/SrfK
VRHVLRDRWIRLAVVAAAIVAVLAASAYAYDSSRDDLIADGVRVAGVDVGGLREDTARRKLRAELAAELERPVRVAVAGRRFHLTPERARLAVDVDGMVAAAVDRSRSAWLGGRVWRGLTGGEVEADVPAEVSYSRRALRAFVRRVKRATNRPPRDATVKFAAASLPAVPSQTGLRLDARRLRRSVVTAIAETGRARKVRGKVRVIQPEVTTDEVAKRYPYVITIERPAFKLRFFKRLGLAKTYKIAVGQVGLETPAGLYHVQNKAINPAWHVPNKPWAGKLAGKVIPGGIPENPLKSRWLGIYNGAGIHGTADVGSLGSAASHGCIRMAIPDVEQLYDQVPLQTPVYIQ